MRAANDRGTAGPEPSCDVPMYDCPACGDRVARSQWSDASTCCSRHLLPTEHIEDRMYRDAWYADTAFRFRSEHR